MDRWLLMVFVLLSSATCGQTYYVGLNADMRGGAAVGGEAIRRGAEMAISEINRSGQLGDTRLELIVKDHRGNPARGADNVQDFASNPDVITILGGIHTPVVLHELPLIHKLKIPYLIPWAAGTPVIEHDYQPSYVFRLSVRDEHAGPVLIKHARDTGIKKVALFLERTGWGRSNDRSMNHAANELGINVVATTWFNWGERQFSQALNDAIEAGAEAIMLVANAPEGVSITRAMAELAGDKRVPIISHWGITGGRFSVMAGRDTLNNVDLRVLQTYLFQESRLNAVARRVQQRYLEQYPETNGYIEAVPGFAHSYDLMHLLALAIKQTKNVSRSNIRQQLENLPSHQGIVRLYQPAFSKDQHEALGPSDYNIARYDSEGRLVLWE